MKSKLLNWVIGLAMLFVIGYSVIYEGFWVWVIENTEVPAGKILVLVAKTGKQMPAGQIIAEPGEKGVLLNPLGPGRHFINPILYERQIKDELVIKGGSVGVVIAKFGKELPPGEFLAGPGERGIQRDVLMPGTYRLNPYAFDVKVVKMIEVDPGYVGVATARSGKPASSQLAEPGERGVQKAVYQPGLYALNPEAYSIERVEIGYNQITMAHAGKLPAAQTTTTGGTKARLAEEIGQGAGTDKVPTGQSNIGVLPAVKFPSTDGFEITIDVTLLWQLRPADAPGVYARYGNLEKIEQNILIPQINSTARIKGSTFGAVDFILGDKREEFQRAFQETLETTLTEKKLQVDLALVQDTLVPDTISAPIQEARVANEWNTTNAEKTKTEARKAELDEMTGRIKQIEQVVEFESQRLEGNIKAAQEKQVTEIGAQTRLLVADLQRQTALIRADIQRKLGAAAATVTEMKGKAEGDAYKLQVAAAGSPADFTNYTFAKQLPDKIQLTLIYAGPGTLWTDLNNVQKIAPLGVFQQLQQPPAPPTAPVPTPAPALTPLPKPTLNLPVK